MVYANIHIIAVFSRECKCFWRTRRRLGHTMRQGPTPENISTRFPMCNSCHSYRASGRCSSSFMRALSNLFAVRGETTDDCTCNCSDTCSCGCSNCCESCTPCTCTPVCTPRTCEPCACECPPTTCTPCTCAPCNCGDTCNCCSGSTGGTDSYYARQYAIGRTYVSGCNSCYMGF